MKKLLLSCLLAFAFYSLRAQDKQAVVKVLTDQSAAWNNGDIEGFMQGYWKSDSLLFIGKSAPVHGWQATLDRYKKSYPGKAVLAWVGAGFCHFKS